MIETVLAVDIGTTSLKAGFITATGEVVSFSKYSFISHNDRFIAHHWMDGLRSCLKRMLKNNPKIIIKAVSVSGNGPTVVSDSGLTLRWNEEYKIDKDRCGNSLFIPKIIAFKELFPKEFERTERIYSGPEYLIYKLTGQAVTVLPEARYVTAYWDNERLLDSKVDVSPEKMPPMKGIGERLGYVTQNVIKFLNIETFVQWNNSSEEKQAVVPVYSCGPDFIAALVGTGTLSPGNICDRYGSSEGFNFCIDKPVPCDGLRLLPSVIPGLWNISALLTISSRLSEKHRLEKVCECIDKLRKYADDNGIDFPDAMTVTGGQTLNKNWMTKKSAALNMKLEVCNFSNSELLGDACAAWYGLGKYASLQEAAEKIVVKDTVYEGL